MRRGRNTSRQSSSRNISAGMPIRKIVCPSHKVDIRYTGNTNATGALDESETTGGNYRDYILKYRLAGDRIESGLLLCKMWK
jgi:Ca-activated chloride channel family protein